MGEEDKGGRKNEGIGKGRGRRGEKDKGKMKGDELVPIVAGVPLKVDKRYEKMSVLDALAKEGVLPINPVEVVDEETSLHLGRQAGLIYGASIYTTVKAFVRDDLPLDARVRLGLKGIRPLLSMIFQGVDTYNLYAEIEERLLRGETFDAIREHLGREEKSPVPTAKEVIDELQKRIRELVAERDSLVAQVKKGKPEEGGGEETKPRQP